MQLIEKVREFIKNHLVSLESYVNLNDEDKIFELGFVDSLFALQLVNFVEGEFKISVDNEDLDLENFSSINAIVAFIEKKRKN